MAHFSILIGTKNLNARARPASAAQGVYSLCVGIQKPYRLCSTVSDDDPTLSERHKASSVVCVILGHLWDEAMQIDMMGETMVRCVRCKTTQRTKLERIPRPKQGNSWW